MSQNKFLKCSCAACGGHIEFPADGIGSTVPCPHCGCATELTLETPPVIAASGTRSLKWIIAGGVILLVGLVAAVGIVIAANRLMKKAREPRPIAASPARPKATNAAPARPSAPAGTLSVLNGFSSSAVTMEQAPGSALRYATGVLKNETDKQRFGVTVEIELLDPRGGKTGTAKDYVDLIEPRAEWKFHASVLQKKAATARVSNVTELKER